MDESLPADHRARELLATLGFTDYEAACLVAVMQHPGASAAEIARHSSLPRSRVYDVADRLAAEGYLEVREGDPKEYRPIAGAEIQAMLRDRYETAVDDLGDALSAVDELDATADGSCSVWSFTGRRASLSRSWELVESAEEWAWLLARPDLLSEDCVDVLQRATDRGVDLTLALDDDELRDWLAESVPGATLVDPPDPFGPASGGPALARVLVTDQDAALTVTRTQETPASSPQFVGCLGTGEECGFVRTHRLLLGLDATGSGAAAGTDG